MPQIKSWQRDINRTNLKIARSNVGLSSMDATNRVCASNTKKIDRAKLWEEGEAFPTYKQLEKLADLYNVNVLQFFIDENLAVTQAPTTFRSHAARKTSYHLYRFIDVLRVRQAIISQSMRADGFRKNELVGMGKGQSDPIKLARLIREKLGYDLAKKDPRQDALAYLRSLMHERQIFVFKTLSMRPIDIDEMKGMYLHDEYAPCIAINRRDHKRSQLFTLAHEIAHLFRADERLDSIEFRQLGAIKDREEAFCNKVAADLLLPAASITPPQSGAYSLKDIKSLAEEHQVSSLVSLFRLADLKYVTPSQAAGFKGQLAEEYEDYKKLPGDKPGQGGNYYNNMRDSNGRLFDEFIFALHAEGRLSAVEAQNLLKLPLTEIRV